MQAKVTFTREADFRRERDFGAKVGATFDFVRAQFRPLLKCLAYFVLPGALVAGIGLGLVTNGILELIPKAGHRAGGTLQAATKFSGANFFTGTSLVGMGLAAVGFLGAFMLLSATVYGFVRVRMHTPPAEGVRPAQVWAFVWPRLGRVVWAWLLLGTAMLVGTSVVSGLLALLGPGFVLLAFFPLLWAAVCLTLYFPILWMEDGGAWAALRRSFYLVQGKWWSSLGLYVVMSFITGIMNYVFIIPFYVLLAVRVLIPLPGLAQSNVLSVLALSIYALGWIFTAVLPLLAMLFQYFNLVERKDGVGLRQMVALLGQTAPPQVSSATYQPDEEGEY